ncbi:hypothetical protein [Paraburkholderia sediminicola]|uniref:hypothetical protein n=1 Tax=Paraburkholderia sediminicola TaxID=458836 RepID=UPI0038BC4C43
MTIKITGTSIPLIRARATATIERFTATQRAGRPHFYFDRFCLDHAVDAIFRDNMTFVSTTDFLSEVIARSAAAHDELNAQKLAWRGRTAGNYIRIGQISPLHRAAVLNLIANNIAAPGHDRGAHTTSPVPTGGGSTREYDLTASRAGRLTVRTLNQRRAYYYSRHHAAATYEYLLITDDSGRPIFRGALPAAVMQVPA